MNENALIAGRYQLAGLLGEGGEARVFRARDLEAARDVAVRLPGHSQPSMQPANLPGFHPGWAALFDSGRDPEAGAYQVFELLEGETLREKIGRAPLGFEAWRTFACESSGAVEALHRAGWTHGDLNAENFFQVKTPPCPWKLLELPFLSFVPATERSTLFGSIHTLAPEQMNGVAADAASDWYALGCLYYYAATGAYPHSGANSREIAISRLRFPPAPLKEKAPDLPPAVSAWVMGLLEPDSRQRASSISAARQLLG